MARFSLTEKQEWFLKTHFSYLLIPIALFFVSAFVVPFAIQKDTREDRVELVGHLTSSQLVVGRTIEENQVFFTVKENKWGFKALNMRDVDQDLFMDERPGAELYITVPRGELKKVEDAIPVLELASKDNVYVAPDHIVRIMRKTRTASSFVGVICFLAAFGYIRRLRKKFRESTPDLEVDRKTGKKESHEIFDPFLIFFVYHPLSSSWGICIFLWVLTSLLLRSDFWLYTFGAWSVVYFIFVGWFRFKRGKIKWILEIAESENQRLAKLATNSGLPKPKHVKAVELLLQNKIDINFKNKSGLTPLHIAVNNGHTEAVDLLLRSGAGVDIQDPDGNTPLMLSVLKGALGIAMKLIAKGASLIIKNKAGDTALSLAQAETKAKALVDMIARATSKALLKAEVEAPKEDPKSVGKTGAAPTLHAVGNTKPLANQRVDALSVFTNKKDAKTAISNATGNSVPGNNQIAGNRSGEKSVDKVLNKHQEKNQEKKADKVKENIAASGKPGAKSPAGMIIEKTQVKPAAKSSAVLVEESTLGEAESHNEAEEAPASASHIPPVKHEPRANFFPKPGSEPKPDAKTSKTAKLVKYPKKAG